MIEPFVHATKTTLLIKNWTEANPGLIAGFTTREGGTSQASFSSMNLGLHVKDKQEDVLANRRLLADSLGFPLEDWVVAEQIHQKQVRTVLDKDKGRGATEHKTALPETDGLITKERGLFCTAFFADCVPLYFLDPVTGWIGIAHAGWKGTVLEVAKTMVEKLVAKDVNPRTLLAAVGPSISGSVYEVDDKLIEKVPEKLKDKTVSVSPEGRILLDLRQLNKEILLQSGLEHTNISITSYCTYRDENLFFSHRRDRSQTGRMLGFIGWHR